MDSPKKFNRNIVLSVLLLASISFFVITVVIATAPDPGHNYTESSGGVAQGNILYGSATDVLSALPKDTNATRYLSNTGTSNNPAWAQVNLANGVTGALVYGNIAAFAGLGDCDTAATSKLLWDVTTGVLSCGTDQGVTASSNTAWTGTNSFIDGNFSLLGSSDATKIAKIEVDGFTSGNTRIFTLPGATGNDTIATLAAANIFTTGQQFNNSVVFQRPGNIGPILTSNTFLTFDITGGSLMGLTTAQTPDTLMLGMDPLSNAIVFIERADIGFDFAHAAATDPTLFIHSHNQNTTQWLGLTHNGTDGVLSVGTGALSIVGNASVSGSFEVGANNLTVLSTGNVGIGTTAPKEKLDLGGALGTTGGNIILGTHSATVPRYLGIGTGTAGSFGVGSGFSGIEFGPAQGTGEGYVAFHTHDAGVSSGERMRIDKSGNVGIGDSTPTTNLDIAGSASVSGTFEAATRFIGPQLMVGDTAASGNTAAALSLAGVDASFYAKQANDAAAGPTFDFIKTRGTFGSPTIASVNDRLVAINGGSYNGSADVGSKASIRMQVDVATWTTTSNPTRITFLTTPANSATLTERMRIANSGNVGIGSQDPIHMLHVASTSDGNVLRLADSDGTCDHNPEAGVETVTCSSDARLKSDISDAASVLAWLDSFRIREYDVKSDGEHTIGTIAQEVQVAHPELVHAISQGDGSTLLGVEQPNLWVLVKAIQELKSKNEELEARLTAAGFGAVSRPIETPEGSSPTGPGASAPATASESESVSGTTAPVITLIGDQRIQLDVGDAYEEQGAMAADDGDSSVAIVITGSVDTATSGSYAIHYNATDTAGNPAEEVTRTVIVGGFVPDLPETGLLPLVSRYPTHAVVLGSILVIVLASIVQILRNRRVKPKRTKRTRRA